MQPNHNYNPPSTYQPLILEKLRQVVFERQRNLREELLKQSRKLFESRIEQFNKEETMEQVVQRFPASVDQMEMEFPKEEGMSYGARLGIKQKKKKKRAPSQVFYARRFQVPGWLVSIPKDFREYLVTVRPAGKRLMVFITGTKCTTRSKNGNLYHTFHTQMVGKSALTTIFEAIYYQQLNTYYLMDIIQWKGTYFTAESASFRHTWLASNIALNYEPTTHCPFKFSRIDMFANTRKNVELLYNTPTVFKKEGLIFVHPQSKYLHLSNEGVLHWKDSKVSEFPIETEDDGKTITMEVKGVGVLSKGGGLYTLDHYKLWQFAPEEIAQINPTECIRFGFQHIRIQENPMETESAQGVKITLEGFRVVSDSNYKKIVADSLSKLVYQYKARHNPITIQDILLSLQ